MKFVLVPPGKFRMGTNPAELDRLLKEASEKKLPQSLVDQLRSEAPEHEVTLTEPFYFGAHHVTLGQFRKFVEATKYRTEAEKDGKGGFGYDAQGKWVQRPDFIWSSPGFPQDDNCPVVQVSYLDVDQFCHWLALAEGQNYWFPTEAQWEFACRAGTATRYAFGDDEAQVARAANLGDQALKQAKTPPETSYVPWNDGFPFLAPVGSFAPNPFGLYDVYGNALQWCEDRYEASYYGYSRGEDPAGPVGGPLRALRGSSFGADALIARSSCRRGVLPSHRSNTLGFRVVRQIRASQNPRITLDQWTPMFTSAGEAGPWGRVGTWGDVGLANGALRLNPGGIFVDIRARDLAPNQVNPGRLLLLCA